MAFFFKYIIPDPDDRFSGIPEDAIQIKYQRFVFSVQDFIVSVVLKPRLSGSISFGFQCSMETICFSQGLQLL